MKLLFCFFTKGKGERIKYLQKNIKGKQIEGQIDMIHMIYMKFIKSLN